MKIFILTEGSSEIGLGHVSRCLALSQAFKEKNFSVKFFISGDQSVLPLLISSDFTLLDWKNTFPPEFDVEEGKSFVLVDSPSISVDKFTSLFEKFKAVLFIDDFRNIQCESSNGVIIDWTPFIEREYPSSMLQKCAYLLGCPYITLRDSFWDVGPKSWNAAVKKIVLTLGGADIRNLTPLILKKILPALRPDANVSVIIGSGFSESNKKEISSIGDARLNLMLSPNSDQIKDEFLSADLAISAGGQTLYELARTQTPTIALEVIENQRGDIEGWREAGFIEYAGVWSDPLILDQISSSLLKLLSDTAARKEMGERGASLVDGQGARRIANFVMERFG